MLNDLIEQPIFAIGDRVRIGQSPTVYSVRGANLTATGWHYKLVSHFGSLTMPGNCLNLIETRLETFVVTKTGRVLDVINGGKHD